MGVPEGQTFLSDFIPNGLLPNEATSVSRVLDPNRWLRAEERTAELIAQIQPNQLSENRRDAVTSYVQRLIMKCFSCQVFTFGSVPLKTYLPDGDIDVTTFSRNQDFKDSWADEVQYILKSEEKNRDAEFCVREVQCINAEVKIIKCLVDNIVVDISFNQLGGLCTLCFLEEVDNLISHDHLFKRSIILIKAWCYYESRILGAHHGLISTYALETLVLYIFHVYNNTFAGPLEVLYRFLEFFSKFDWDNYCLSLFGPVPLGSLPNLRAEPARKDCGELLLSKCFLDACTSVYAVIPSSQENQELPLVSKYFNIIDPLRANNNLGRSVSKGNFFRIKSAFAFGAQQLMRLLDCSEENLIAEFDLFFRNTWDRHGKGHWPDAPGYDLYQMDKNFTENLTFHDYEADTDHPFQVPHAENQQYIWKASYDWKKDDALEAQNALSGYNRGFDLALNKEDGHSSESFHQEELDSLNNAGTYRNRIFNGYLQAPVSVNSHHLSSPAPLPTLASWCSHANDMLPPNVPSLESFWGYHKPYFQSLVPCPASQSFPSSGMTSQDEITKLEDNHLLAADLEHGDQGEGFLSEQHMNSVRGYTYKDVNFTASSRSSPASLSTSMCPPPRHSINQLGPCSNQGAEDREGLVPFAHYQDGPPFQREAYDAELGNFHEYQSRVSLDASARFKSSNTLNNSNRIRHGATMDSFDIQRSDIFQGDFMCYWQNLQYGRHCQNTQLQGLFPCSPSFIPQSYMQGQFPCDVSGIPLSNMNIMGRGPRLVPLVPMQRGFDSHESIGQHFGDQSPRYSGGSRGTGTYLPNPRFNRSRDYSNTRNQRGNYNYNRRDHPVERERNWNSNSRPRFAGRGRFRYQAERPDTRMYKTNPGNRRSDQSWNSSNHGSFPPCNSHNESYDSLMPNYHVAANVPYGMHPFPVVGAGEISPPGYILPSMYPMYPYDHNSGYDYHGWPEFRNLGPAPFSGENESSHQGEDSPSAVNNLANYEGNYADSYPVQPLPTNFHRSLQD